jgi:hypothetical protein
MPEADVTQEIRILDDWAPLDAPTTTVCVVAHPPAIAGRNQALRESLSRRRMVRELRTRPPAGYRTIGVHLASSRELRTGPRARFVRWIRAGMLIELHRHSAVPRLLDEVFARAGATGPFRVGSGGEILADIGPNLLRASVGPQTNTKALRVLTGRLHVPHVIASGNVPRGVRSVGWSIETRLGGRRPRRVERALAHDLVAFSACLPRFDSEPTASLDDLADLRESLPGHAPVWREIAPQLADPTGEPAVARHGDLWIGNLLARRGRLSGVVDWDTWHPAGVPGTDLLHLYAFDPSVPLGRRVRERPWRSAEFADFTRWYWRALGIRVTTQRLDGVGLAWWVGQIAAALRRDPQLARDEQWIDENISTVATTFA